MEEYVNPFASRYSSKAMLSLFSPHFKYSTWRKLWLALAESEKELGLSISDSQIESLRAYVDTIDFDSVSKFERELKHEVMAHLHAYAEVAGEEAGKIIHLGATSAYLMDNTDLIQMRDGFSLLEDKLLKVIHSLQAFCLQYKDLPIVGYTHFQQAQLTTLGKRAGLWLQSLYFDWEELGELKSKLAFRGVKGTVGTQDSFKALFKGDWEKVQKLDQSVAEKMGFDKTFSLTGQTYDRKWDSRVLNFLSNLAQTAHKMTNDIRLMQHLREVEENFAKKQIGSSAMAYKRNPIYSERVSSLAKFVMSLPTSSALVASTQWLERTLDDSACRRLNIPQAFMGAEAILILLDNIVSGLRVNEKLIAKHTEQAMPFIATEEILMKATEKGGDRQALHERIREHSMQVTEDFYEAREGEGLLDLILNDPMFNLKREDLSSVLDPSSATGFAGKQIENFIKQSIKPILDGKDFTDSTAILV